MKKCMELWGRNSSPKEIWKGGERLVFESLQDNVLLYPLLLPRCPLQQHYHLPLCVPSPFYMILLPLLSLCFLNVCHCPNHFRTWLCSGVTNVHQ